jgi:two-component system sensor histidine kinase DesK
MDDELGSGTWRRGLGVTQDDGDGDLASDGGPRGRLGIRGSLPPFTWQAWALIWLVYFFYGLGDAVDAQRVPRLVPAELAILAAFIVCYAYVMVRAPWQRPLPGRPVALALLCALTAALILWQRGEWVSLLAYVSLGVAVSIPTRPAIRIVPVLAAAAAVAAWLTGHPPTRIFMLAFQTVVAGYAVLAFTYGAGMNRALRGAQADLARMAVAEERLRFARDLHDLLGHSLSLIALKSQLIARLAETDPARAAAEARDVERAARRALGEVREAVVGYRRVTLAAELVGARAALEAANVRHDVGAAPAALPAQVEQVLGWTVREGVTNVLRHSGADRCEIRFDRVSGTVGVEIVDDGRGPGRPGDGDGSGLAGLAERVAGSGGRLVAGPGPGRGFRLRVEMPLAPAVDAAAPAAVATVGARGDQRGGEGAR